jgi:hypothetical protein
MTYIQNDIRIPVVERSISLLRPWGNVKVFYPPDLHTDFLTCFLPSGLCVSCVLPDALFELQPVVRLEGNIGAEVSEY